jgi:hypothetical protein
VNTNMGDAVVGDADYYTTLFDPTTPAGPTGQFNFMINNDVVVQLAGTFTPLGTQVASEIHAGGDQLAGGAQAPEHFTDTYAYWPAGIPAAGSPSPWQSFDQQHVNESISDKIKSYARMSLGNPAAGITVNTWDNSCTI